MTIGAIGSTGTARILITEVGGTSQVISVKPTATESAIAAARITRVRSHAARSRAPDHGSNSSPSAPPAPRPFDRKSRRSSRTPMPTTIAIPMARGDRATSGIVVGQACEPGLMIVTPAIPHNGRCRSQRANGPRMAAAPASRTWTQVRHDGPFQSSAMR